MAILIQKGVDIMQKSLQTKETQTKQDPKTIIEMIGDFYNNRD